MTITLLTQQATMFEDLHAFSRASGKRAPSSSEITSKRTRVRHCCSLQRRRQEQALGIFRLQKHNRARTSFDRVKTIVIEINYKTYYVATFLTFPNCIATRNTSKISWELLINADWINTSALISRFKRLEISLYICLSWWKTSVLLTFSAKTSVYLQTYIPLSVKSSLFWHNQIIQQRTKSRDMFFFFTSLSFRFLASISSSFLSKVISW